LTKLSFAIPLIFLWTACSGQKEHILYHKYYQSASDYNIEKWNIVDTTGQEFLLKETVDAKGRVTKLEFLDNGQPASSLCYLANKVTFKYQGNKIIETLYLSDSIMYATDCEMYYKRIYLLDKDNFITRVEKFAKYDTINLGGSTLKQWKEWVPEHVNLDTANNLLQVDYYLYSFAKFNGIYPVSRNFKLTDVGDYYGDEPEKQSIVKGLQKLWNNNR
jgi:hypothetical protein